MGLYEEMVAADIAGPYAQEFINGQLELHKNNTIDGPLKLTLDTPWIYAKYPKDRDCIKWSNGYFEKYGFISRRCMGCWKVAMKIPTFELAYQNSQLQLEIGLPGKTGMDRRWYTPTLWSAFWYAPIGCDLDEARKFYKTIARAVKKRFGNKIKPILKRACTEFEIKFGNSDKWKYTEADRQLEALLDTVHKYDSIAYGNQPTLVKNHVMKKWFMYAHEHGDMTYLKYADRSISAPPITYHDSIHNPRDFEAPKGSEFESDNDSRDSRKIAIV